MFPSLILSVADISTLYNRLMNISATKFISGCDEGGDTKATDVASQRDLTNVSST